MSVSTELNLTALISVDSTASGFQINYGVSDPDNHLVGSVAINSIVISSSTDGGVTFPPEGVLLNGLYPNGRDKSTLPDFVPDTRVFPPNTNILYGLIITTTMGEIDPVGVNVVVGGQIGVQAPLASLITKKKKGRK